MDYEEQYDTLGQQLYTPKCRCSLENDGQPGGIQ